MRYKRIGNNLNVMRHSACLVINPIMVDGFAALFSCTPVERASDSTMARPKSNEKAMHRNLCNQKENSTLKTKMGNKQNPKRHDTTQTNGLPSGQLFLKRWSLSNPNRLKA